jgi:hypothetical protein
LEDTELGVGGEGSGLSHRIKYGENNIRDKKIDPGWIELACNIYLIS